MTTVAGIIAALGMIRHPEGGWYVETFTVAPGFDFSQFELAEPGWEPGKSK